MKDYIHDHIAFSTETFGPGPRTEGLVKHLRSELIEVAQASDEERLEEMCDLIILSIDGAWRAGIDADLIGRTVDVAMGTVLSRDCSIEDVRDAVRRLEASSNPRGWWGVVLLRSVEATRSAGYTYAEIQAALWAKLVKNKARTWPDWRSVPEGQPIEHDRSTDEPPQGTA